MMQSFVWCKKRQKNALQAYRITTTFGIEGEAAAIPIMMPLTASHYLTKGAISYC